MFEPLNIAVAIHVVLFFAVWGYAAWLDRHPGYAPDWTWTTVAVGNGLIIFALAFAAWLTPFVPWQAVLIDFTLSLIAAIPIIRWQRRQAHQRAAERAAAKERLKGGPLR